MDSPSLPCSLGRAAAYGGRWLALAGLLSTVLLAGATERTRAAGETRTLAFFNIHNKETTTVAFKKDGQLIAGALEKFNWAFRDWRTNEPTHMDPALLDLLWEIHTELGSRQPIHIISGYRSRATNEQLRATVGGQASESRHILGKAADVHFPDVPLKALRYSAMVRERGGVGYYPTSAIEFVHVDTDRVRHWPRMPRYELALLFPSGHSKHQPADGGPLTPDDVRLARSEHRDLARQVAAFYDSRAGRRPPVAIAGLDAGVTGPATTQVAAAAPVPVPIPSPTPAQRPAGLQMASYEPPRLLEPPRLVDRPTRLAAPDPTAQARLTDLIQRASFAPPAAPARAPEPKLLSAPVPARRPGTVTAALVPPPQPPPLPPQAVIEVSQAPDFDEDHPEELSYRPFPIAPFMTQTASVDDPALALMTHPDAARTFELLDSAGSMPPLRLRPGIRVAEAMFAQESKGEAINMSALQEVAARGAVADRKVKTQ